MSRAVCPTCETMRNTRFMRRTVHLEHPNVDVEDVLVDVCTVCGSIVTVPAQSAPRLREARKRQLVSYEARIPTHLHDALWVVASRHSALFNIFENAVFRYYLRRLSSDAKVARRIHALAAAPIAQGKVTGRISFKIDRPTWDATWKAAHDAGFDNRSQIARGVLAAVAIDSGVAHVAGEKPKPDFAKAIETIALSAVGA